MALTFDPSTDFEDVTDGLEAISVRPQINSNTELVSNGRFNSDLTGWAVVLDAVWDDGLAHVPELSSLTQTATGALSTDYLIALDVRVKESAIQLRLTSGDQASGAGNLLLETITESGHHVFTFTSGSADADIEIQVTNTNGRDGYVDNLSVKVDADTSVASALRRALNSHEIEVSDGKYQGGDVAWHVPAALLTTVPEVGDVVIDSGSVEFAILSVRQDTLANRWRCVTREIDVSDEADTLVTLRKWTESVGTEGASEGSYADYALNVRARIQRQDGENVNESERRRQTYPVIVYTQHRFHEIDHRFVVRDADGIDYKVSATRTPERLDRAFEIHAEKTPWRRG